MRSILTRLEGLAAVLAGAGVAALAMPLGCSGGLQGPQPTARTDDAHPRRGGVLHLASPNDMRGLDPAGVTDGLISQALLLIFDGLVDFDADGHVIPNLAESWDVSDEGRTYRFVLRQGVRMHDGGELTADDVKRSVERALHPSTPCETASDFDGLVGFAAYVAGQAPHLEGVTVEGRYEVAFHLEQPDGAFVAMLAMPSMRPVCATAGDRYVDSWLPCGTGPFELEPGGWQRGIGLRLVRNEAYFRPGLPYLDAVEWTFGMGVVPQRFRFEDGTLDMLLNPTQADVGRFATDPRWKGLDLTLVDNVVWGEAMNTRLPPFDNVEVRRAVAAAIRRDHLAMIKPANISPLTQLLPRGVPGYDPTFEGQRYDEAAALEHMRKAGYAYDPATERGGWPRPVPYTVADPTFESFAVAVLQQDLARIGIHLQAHLVTWPAYLAIAQRAGASAMHPQGDSSDYPDPSAFFDHLFLTSAISAEGTSNTAFYSNPRYDDLVARAHHSLDADQRRALYREANELLCDEAPWAFSHGQHDFVMRQPYVRGFERHPVWPFDVRRVWLDRADTAALPSPSAGLR
jgi:ABC-type transport system substrate-binding protein